MTDRLEYLRRLTALADAVALLPAATQFTDRGWANDVFDKTTLPFVQFKIADMPFGKRGPVYSHDRLKSFGWTAIMDFFGLNWVQSQRLFSSGNYVNYCAGAVEARIREFLTQSRA